MLKGELGTFSIGEVFQSLALSSHTGTLKISAPDTPTKLIYFERGEITLFSSGSSGVPRIGEMLIRMGKLTEAQLDEALGEQRRTKEVLGKLLVRKGVILEEDLARALKTKIKEELYDLFLWETGSFEFHLDYFPDDLIDDVQRSTRITLDVNSVTMEGLRQLDEWGLIRQTIRTFNEILAPAHSPYEGDDRLCLAMLKLFDGSTPVRDALKNAPSSRFECCRAIHELIETGKLRYLNEEELRSKASASLSENKAARAAVFLRYAVERDPEGAELFQQLGHALSKSYQDQAASEAYGQALRILFERGDFKAAAESGEQALRRNKLDPDNLERLLRTYIELGNTKRAMVVADQLVSLLEKQGEIRKAAELLEPLTRLDPRDLNLRIQIATLLDKAGDKAEAVRRLEEVSEDLEKGKRYREQVRILRLITQIAPDREDVKTKIVTIQELQEKREKRKRKRLVIGLSVSVAALVLVAVPAGYEWSARSALRRAEAIERKALETGGDLAEAREKYEKVIMDFGFSGVKAKAESRLQGIAHRERERARQEFARLEEQRNAREARIREMNEEVAKARDRAAALLENGEIAEAHRICSENLKKYPEVTSEDALPLRITTTPSGASLSLDGRTVGRTPYLLWYRPGDSVQILLTRSSCEPVVRTVELKDQWQLHFDLERMPLADLAVVPVIDQPMVASGRRLIVASRDGVLYAIDPLTKAVPWQIAVGRYGDRVSGLAIYGQTVFLGTVSAEVTAVSVSTGHAKWIARVGASVLAAPGISRDGKWVAVGTTRGTVEVLEAESGALVAKFSTENEILSRPVFLGELLLVGSTDNALYGYSMTTGKVEYMEEFESDIVQDLCILGERVFLCTTSGQAHCVLPLEERVAWSVDGPSGGRSWTAMSAAHGVVLLGSSDGTVTALEAKTGGTIWRTQVGSGSVSGISPLRADAVYVTTEDGLVGALDVANRRALWDDQSDTSFLVPPVFLGGHLCVGGSGGRIKIFEVVE